MDINKIIDLLKKNWKYLSGAVIFVIIIIVLIQVSGGGDKEVDSKNTTTTPGVVSTTTGDTTMGDALNLNEQLEEKPIQTIEDGTDVYKGIETLVNQYFTATANDDVDALKGILNQMTEADEQEVLSISERTESYENVKLRLVKSGMEADSYVAFVSYEGKYVGVDTLAPGLMSFYICTKTDGSLYIYNNLDDNTKLYVYTMREEDEEVAALRKEIQNSYAQALDSDASLREFVESLQSDSQTAQATDSPTQEPEETQQPEPTQAPADNDTSSASVVAALENVTVRNNPNQTADAIGTLEKGQTATRLGAEGEWTKIEYKGSEGYVKTEYLQAAEGSSATASNPNTFKIRAKETVNVRKHLSESADRVGVAYAGDTFDCVMEYEDGWSKIIYNGSEAYVKTEFFERQ